MYFFEDFSLDPIENKHILLLSIQYIKDTQRDIFFSPTPLPPPPSTVLHTSLINFSLFVLSYLFVVNGLLYFSSALTSINQADVVVLLLLLSSLLSSMKWHFEFIITPQP